MGPIILSYGSAAPLTLDVPPSYPSEFSMDSGVIEQFTGGGQPRRFDTGVQVQTFIMEWTKEKPLSVQSFIGGYNPFTGVQAAGTQSLLNFWVNVVKRGLLPFSFSDPDGAYPLPALFTAGKFHFKKIPGSGYAGVIGIDYVSLFDMASGGSMIPIPISNGSTVPSLDSSGDYWFEWCPATGPSAGQKWLYFNSNTAGTVTPVMEMV